jgi:hypothetical protein
MNIFFKVSQPILSYFTVVVHGIPPGPFPVKNSALLVKNAPFLMKTGNITDNVSSSPLLPFLRQHAANL